jgi:hypothetical protein
VITLARFLADDTAGTRRGYLATASVVSLFTAGTIYGARLLMAEKLDAVLAALRKTPGLF